MDQIVPKHLLIVLVARLWREKNWMRSLSLSYYGNWISLLNVIRKNFYPRRSIYTFLKRNRSFLCVVEILFVVCCDRCGGFCDGSLVCLSAKNQFVHVVLCVAF